MLGWQRAQLVSGAGPNFTASIIHFIGVRLCKHSKPPPKQRKLCPMPVGSHLPGMTSQNPSSAHQPTRGRTQYKPRVATPGNSAHSCQLPHGTQFFHSKTASVPVLGCVRGNCGAFSGALRSWSVALAAFHTGFAPLYVWTTHGP